jgi:oligopeptide/dipeptide ABC transporter ATP-binding protein
MGLIRAVPTISGARQDLISIPGTPPDLIDLPPGCTFHPRCPYATAICQKEEPRLEAVGVNHQVACWNWQEAVRDQGARLAVETGI